MSNNFSPPRTSSNRRPCRRACAARPEFQRIGSPKPLRLRHAQALSLPFGLDDGLTAGGAVGSLLLWRPLQIDGINLYIFQ